MPRHAAAGGPSLDQTEGSGRRIDCVGAKRIGGDTGCLFVGSERVRDGGEGGVVSDGDYEESFIGLGGSGN